MMIQPVMDALESRLHLHADFNGDAIDDLVFHDTNTGQVIVKYLSPTNAVIGEELIGIVGSPGWELINVTDFDDDSDGDLLWRNQNTGRLLEWTMNWSTLQGFKSWPSAALAEWDFGGTIEVEGPTAFDDQAMLWRHNSDGRLVMWMMDGRSIASTVQLGAGPKMDWQVAGISEVRPSAGGIDTEILWRNEVNGKNRIWEIRDSRYVSQATVKTVGLAYRVAGWQYAEENEGGRLIWQHEPTGQIIGWQFNVDYTIADVFTLPSDPDPARLVYAGGDTT